MEHQEIIDGGLAIAEAARELVGRLHSKARAIEAVVDGDIARGDGARRGMLQDLPDGEVLEIVTGVRLGSGHFDPMASIASAMPTVRRAISACSSSTIRPSTVITPLP